MTVEAHYYECNEQADCKCVMDAVRHQVPLAVMADNCRHAYRVITYAGFSLRYRLDNRLGDVISPAGNVIDCVQVARYDWQAGRVVPGSHEPHEALRTFLVDNALI